MILMCLQFHVNLAEKCIGFCPVFSLTLCEPPNESMHAKVLWKLEELVYVDSHLNPNK